MIDIEKVIKGLENCLHYKGHCLDCPYNSPNCQNDVLKDAIALLNEQENDIHHMGLIIDEYEKEMKEQEAVEPIPPKDESDLWRCGNCNHQLFRCTHQRYCEMCGREVKWE